MAFTDLLERANLVTDIGASAAVLGWDQETYMPEGAVQARSEQLSTLSGLAHKYLTDSQAERIVAKAELELDAMSPRQQAIVRTFANDHRRAIKLPAALVSEQAKTASLAQAAWFKAKKAADFRIFQPLLEKTVDLKRQEALALGSAEHPYDNLLDAFEPGLTVATVTPVFDTLRAGTTALLQKIQPVAGIVKNDVLFMNYDGNKQLALAREIISSLGFDYTTGRVDLSAHPFCTSFSSTDVRLTTRIRSNDLRSCLFGLIHEAGHGMYEQGIHPELARTPSAQGASMGIHESQSLFWENMIARSPAFWEWAYPRLQETFPENLANISVATFIKAINLIEPSFNRVESDEVTYNLHIILRFEIERDLLAGNLEVADIPRVWNEKMQTSLGITPPNDAEGCLQDVHWSFGGLGYFPSYTLGKLYAAMLWNALKTQQPTIEQAVQAGNFAPVKEWLATNIHQYGRTETPHEIITRVSGRSLTADDFLSHVHAKAAMVYGI